LHITQHEQTYLTTQRSASDHCPRCHGRAV
jgi:hypothetical protein